MKARFWLRLACGAFAIAAASAGPGAASPTYSALYAFGDSLSDGGNFYIYSSDPANRQFQASVAPYWNHEFSNGRVWVQALSLQLGMGPLTASLSGGTDYAYSGSHSGTTLVGTAGPTDLPTQFAQFETNNPAGAPASALYTLESGPNDIIGAIARYSANKLTLAQAQQSVAMAAQNVATFASDLHSDGAGNLLVYEAPDMGLAPAFNAGANGALATSLSALFNTDLLADLAPVERGGLNVYTLNVFAIEDAMVAKPRYYGFTNVTQGCWTGSATDSSSGTLCAPTPPTQDHYLFWDSVHTTESANWQLATAARQALAAGATQVLLSAQGRVSGVPEPLTWSLMASGLFGVGGAMRFRRRTVARA